MIWGFLLFIPIALTLDFRSQAYKNTDIYSQQPIILQQTLQQVSNPYKQFAPNAGQPVVSQPLPTAPQTYSNSNQYFGSTEAQKSSESVDYANLYNKLTSAALSVAANQPSFPLSGILPASSESNQQPGAIPSSPSQRTSAPYETTTATEATPPPVIWTTKKPTTKLVAKMSKLSRPLKKEDKNSTTAAQVLVPSHRLLNDILVLPSTRRLYVLALLPIHESHDNKGFECGKVDVNGFIRLAAFMDALEQVNSQPILRDAGLGLGAVIVDSCSSDLRTVADLYELLSGTNIQKSDLIAMIRDDGSYLPNVDDFARHLKIPVINTFFSTREQFMATGTLPSIVSPLETMISLLTHTQSDCVSLIYDDLYEESAKLMGDMAFARGVCIEQKLSLKGDSLTMAESAVRRLLLTEARVVVVLLGEGSWVQLMKALRTEMVIAGRFIMITVQHPRWFTSQNFLEMWPHFDQLLLTVSNKKPKQTLELQHLNSRFPSFAFPQHWMRQFWSTAFHCHIEGENESGQQFSKECSDKQLLNLTSVAPDIDIAPITLAVHSIAHATRKLVDNVCPGALVQSLHDCLNDPQESLFSSIMALRFPNPMVNGDVTFNETSGYRDSPIVVNRVVYDSQIEVEELARWDTVSGFTYTSPLDLVMEERDGTRVPLRSSCPKSSCASELAKRSQSGFKPSFNDSLSNTYLLIYTIGAVLAFFICMLCMYHQIVCSRDDNYSICTVLLFAGLSLLCLVSVFFVMKPNAISCICRRIAFSISMACVFAPVLVKTLAVWKLELSFEQSQNPIQTQRPNQHTLFWIVIAIVTIQAVISSEWSLFESPTEVTFTSSVQHGHQWRCAPGDQFEQRLLHSCSLSGLMIIITLVCSILSVRHIESRQNILIAIIGGIFGLGLYLGLPLLPYTLRDQVIAGASLVYSLIIIMITYCRGAFSKDDDDNKSLVGKSTLDRSEKNPYWLDNLVLSPRSQQAMSLQRNYHHVHTLPANIHPVEKFAHETYTTPRIVHSTNTHPPRLDNKVIPRLVPSTLQRPQRNSAPYGIDSYELPPLSPNHQVQYQSQSTLPYGAKYGKQEYVMENDEEENCRL
ncbi:unnamed protein product [Auanema sp. JU1783]|nr:unnamed protein product [Auanema sp. JU1783]